jgi:hypothetical protein
VALFTFALRPVGFTFPDSDKRFFFVRPNTDIFGLITNEVSPLEVDIGGNTLATLEVTHSGSNVDFAFFDSELTVTRSSADENSLPAANLTGCTFQWYYSTISIFGENTPEGFSSILITGATSVNFTPSNTGNLSGTNAKCVRCGVTYASGSKTVFSKWIPIGSNYILAQKGIRVGNTCTNQLLFAASTNATYKYFITDNTGTTQYSDSSDFSSSLSGTFTTSNNSATFNITTSSSISVGDVFYISIKNQNDAVSATSLALSEKFTTISKEGAPAEGAITFVKSDKSVGTDTITLGGLEKNDFVMFLASSDADPSDTNSNITASNAGTITSVDILSAMGNDKDMPFHKSAYFFVSDTSTVITPPSSFNDTGQNAKTVNSAAVFRGVDTSTPLDVAFTSDFQDSNRTSQAPPAITTVSANTMIVAMIVLDDEELEGDISGIPSGYTKAVHSFGSVTSNKDSSNMIVYKTRTSTGTENPDNFIHTNDRVALFTFALRLNLGTCPI